MRSVVQEKSKRIAQFWRAPELSFLEARAVADGRAFSHAKHAHETFSIGAITAGRSTYLNGRTRQTVGAGTLVLMNPGDTHACNPIADQDWSYLMFYVDSHWLRGLQEEQGLQVGRDMRAFASTLSTDARLYTGLLRLFQVLIAADSDTLQRHSAAVEFFSLLQQGLDPAPLDPDRASHKLLRAADFIHEHCLASPRLEDICQAAELSPSYLIRAFKQHYGMTPHAFLLNRRIQVARTLLRQGAPLADVALETGFADQAHFQRAFKQLLAATPGQYRSA
ncbi:MAG: AraC family transcriptional regulator [Pseudomonas sp.]|uniref:AraC family transcriptional regulator n=1 Tax=Pseudomonas sp. TaxID=306 RepID=UPI003390BE0B